MVDWEGECGEGVRERGEGKEREVKNTVAPVRRRDWAG